MILHKVKKSFLDDIMIKSIVLKTKAIIDTFQYGIVDIVKLEHYKKNLALKIWSGLILKNKGDFL